MFGSLTGFSVTYPVKRSLSVKRCVAVRILYKVELTLELTPLRKARLMGAKFPKFDWLRLLLDMAMLIIDLIDLIRGLLGW